MWLALGLWFLIVWLAWLGFVDLVILLVILVLRGCHNRFLARFGFSDAFGVGFGVMLVSAISACCCWVGFG